MTTETDIEFAPTSNRSALEKTIAALDGLKAEHSALIQHARSLADAIDGFTEDLKVHTEYRHVLAELLDVGKGEELDAYASLMQKIADDARRASQQ